MTNALPQRFSLPHSMMNSMLKNPSSYEGLFKVYQTCKYFFLKQRLLFFDKFECSSVHGGYFFIGRNYQEKGTLLWFDSYLRLELIMHFPAHQIFRCTLEVLDLVSTDITIADFDLIIKHSKIRYYYNQSSYVICPDGSHASLDAILQKLPDVISISHSDVTSTITSEMIQNINAIKFKNKLQEVYIDILMNKNIFKPLLFCDFIKLNAAPASNWEVSTFDIKNARQWHKSFKRRTTKLLKKWEIGKPSIRNVHYK